MQRSLFGVALVLSLIATCAVPAQAGKGAQSSASATITVVGSCTFELSYAWSGFSTANVDAVVGLASREAGGANFIFGRKYSLDQLGSGGSISATFTLTGNASLHSFYAFGQLFKSGNRPSTVRDSYAESINLAAQACGEEVAIS